MYTYIYIYVCVCVCVCISVISVCIFPSDTLTTCVIILFNSYLEPFFAQLFQFHLLFSVQILLRLLPSSVIIFILIKILHRYKSHE